MYKIESITKDFSGIRYGVKIVNGVGYTDSEQAIAWFRENGYKVIAPESKIEVVEVEVTETEVEETEDKTTTRKSNTKK